MSEILAPSGDKNSALAAINAGADAIYLGLKQFSARSSAENFDYTEFKEIAQYAHLLGVKVYVAMNTMVKNDEISGFLHSVKQAVDYGADAIILSDLFLGAFIKKNFPQIHLHLSTQAGVCNEYGAVLAKECGFERVILARETSFEDIENITKIIETEVFVQGALCTCFSGQCYLSSFAGGNSGNRGKCKQPCRKRYYIDRAGFEENAYRLSLSDLSIGEDIEKLKKVGVFSFKIEGRMRRPEYVAAAVKHYKSILNGTPEPQNLSDLKRTFNRGNYTKGLTFGQDKSFISSAVQGHIGEYVGVVKVENGKYIVKSGEKFVTGDGYKVLRDAKEIGGAVYSGDIKGGFIINSRERLKNGDKVFITTDVKANSRILQNNRKVKIDISAYFIAGNKAKIVINGNTFYGEKELQTAQNRPLTVEDIKSCFNKTDKLPFKITFGEIQTNGVFVPTSELNALRRTVFSGYVDIITKSSTINFDISLSIPTVKCSVNAKIAAISMDLNGVCADVGILKPNDYSDDFEKLAKHFSGEKFLYLPPYLTGKEIEQIIPAVKKFDGIYCDGIYGFKLAQKLNKPFFAGTGLNLSNCVDISLCKAKYIALSKELTDKEAQSLFSDNVFCLTTGAIKVMDLIYCPFEKKCKTCDKRNFYTLTDENGRKFPIRRYKTAENCRFEVYNCANFVSERKTCGSLVDCTLEENAENLLTLGSDIEKIKKYFNSNYTYGHTIKPVE